MLSPLGTRAWISSGDQRRVAVYDTKTRKLLVTLNADAPPQHIWLSRRLALITSGDDGLVRSHNLRGGRLMRSARLPHGSWNVTGDGTRALSPSQGTLTLIGRNGRTRWHRQIARAAHDACLAITA